MALPTLYVQFQRLGDSKYGGVGTVEHITMYLKTEPINSPCIFKK
jgi:hypothetical protein